MAIPGDLRDESFCKQLVDKAVSGLGGLDILVSNAGRQQLVSSIHDLTTEMFDATMKTNIYAPFLDHPCCHATHAAGRYDHCYYVGAGI